MLFLVGVVAAVLTLAVGATGVAFGATKPKPKIFFTQKGVGNGTTKAFTVPASWVLQWGWTCSGHKATMTVTVGSKRIYHSTGFGGGGTQPLKGAGTHRVKMQVASVCTWTVSILK
jgi:hypothetical protein